MTGEPAQFLFEARDNRGLPGNFAYWAAPNGHIFLDPVPEDLGRHYAGGYQPIPRDEAELARAAKADDYRLETIQQLKPRGSFLEIGPWIGLTAYSALKRGYEVSVFEREQACVDLLNRCGIAAVQTADPAEALRNCPRTFDIIGLWHSIEHLPKPWEVVEAAAQALKPGGLLVIAAPNPESAQFLALGKNWLHLDAPRHLHFLPISVVEAIAAEQGLVTVDCTTDDKLGLMIDEHGWRWEVNRHIGRGFGFRSIVCGLLWRLLRRRYRTLGALDGASYTVIMMNPPLSPELVTDDLGN
jgi:SAM-dependent methyltransferase